MQDVAGQVGGLGDGRACNVEQVRGGGKQDAVRVATGSGKRPRIVRIPSRVERAVRPEPERVDDMLLLHANHVEVCRHPDAVSRIFASMFIYHAVWYSRRDSFGTFPQQSSESVRDALIDFFLQAMASPCPVALPLR